jgi:Ca-activated chloride channel family protein
VSYSDDVTIEVPIAKFDMTQKSYFQGGINGLTANGSTASYDAVVVAMDMIEKAKKDHPDAKAMIFLLSDGQQNVGYSLDAIDDSLKESQIPVYTISYTAEADTDAMKKLSEVNEAATINADSDDIVYKIKSLFNSQM